MLLAIVCFIVAFYFQATNRIYSLIALAVGLILFPNPMTKGGYLFRSILALICIGFAAYIYLGYFPNAIIQHEIGELTVHYIDVGQGESTFIELPNQETILIDAGTYEEGVNVTNYIKKLGYTKIDYVVVTHSHADHIGGMSQILPSFKVKEVYISNPTVELNPDSYSYHHFLDLIKQKQLNLQYAYTGTTIIDKDNVLFKVISPKKDANYIDLNQYSLMTYLKFGNTAFLFTGDAGYSAEYDLEAGDIQANVLQVGHHGSSFGTSTPFLKRVLPEIAIISVAAENENNLPNVNTITSIENENIKIYRTDQSGSIIVSSDGNTITNIETTGPRLHVVAPEPDLVPNN